MINLNKPLRALQASVAITTLGLNGHVSHWYFTHTHPSICPNAPLFLIFVASFTILALPYLFFNPPLSITHANRESNPKFFNKWAVLALDSITCIFWFAGWLDMAVFRGHLILCGGHVCAFMSWGAAIGAVAWLTFLGTTVLASLHVIRTRGAGTSGMSQPQSHDAWVGMQKPQN